MAKQNIIRGKFVKFDVSGVRVTQALQKALQVLDEECRHGSGGTWDIDREGRTYVAIPNGPFNEVIFNKKKNRWEDG